MQGVILAFQLLSKIFMNYPENHQLSEKKFIQDDIPKNPIPFLFWGFLLTLIIVLIWGGELWYANFRSQQLALNPFLRVTNRELSLFLWQNSSYMRPHARSKSGYLPGFQYINSVGMDLESADSYAIAPPELLFLYHTWNRLLKKEFTPRPILISEFEEFLEYLKEWNPQNWPQAPKEYIKLLRDLPKMREENLLTLPLISVPIEVQMAFQGWKNYFKEGPSINKIRPLYKEIKAFMESHPHYARNYWRNIVSKESPNYLKSLTNNAFDPDAIFPNDELTVFLKVALYNYTQASKKII